ncbi:dual specificity protein phosphatase 3-like [Lytechinus variegatus]|uniref:dual specificity protein phosphatase 3-like n=1 Tax=Lytechinus variegatus TaxID=7654 RepID=UPI001BB20D88|nr:dual specificity protein phosphatase 3-like [Lytechinus variegatus]
MGSKVSCTPRELILICEDRKGAFSFPTNNEDEVYDRVFVGGRQTATDKDKLKALGITHVLNCAQGIEVFNVDTDQRYYQDVNIKYCGLPVNDEPEANIKKHFKEAVSFIDQALKQENGKVLVHCVAGFSRSATVAIAYLMIRRGMTAQEATRTVRRKRPIGPNEGFLKQLCQLNTKLYPL